jgi:7-cyano-7-deazaguanine synthase
LSHEKALVLLSGGLDSATALAVAREQNFQCYALSFRYGQRHSEELAAAQKIATSLDVVEHRIFDLDLSLFSNSALTNHELAVPTTLAEGIPITYVPARNVIFLSIALGWAEVLHARHIFLGVNAVDYSGYPDCRPAFVEAFEFMANLATKSAVEGATIKIHTPLINLTKAEIISTGLRLGVNYAETVSCYQASNKGEACGECDSCRLRAEGFKLANVQDPTKYKLG